MQVINWGCCPLVRENPTMRAFIEQQARERKSPSTIENYARDLNDFLTAFPDTAFSDLLAADEAQIAHYVDWLWTRHARRGSGAPANRGNITYLTGSKLAPSTIRRRISALRSFYRWTIRLHHRHDPINPVREGVHGRERGLISVPQSVPWVPDERQGKAILKYVLTRLSIRDQAIVLLAHDGALRREEIVLLRIDDIDRQTHTSKIRAEITKNKMSGISVLSQPTWTRLNEYIEEDRAALVLAYGAEETGPLFLSDSHRNPGQPLSKWTIKDIFDRIGDDLHIPQPTPHKMRHLMLTELNRSGMELLDVSRYARHRRISSTEIYLPTDLSDLARQVNKAHNFLERIIQQMEEKLFIHKYLTASRSYLAYWTKSWLGKLTRFEAPFLDTVRLISDSDYSLVAGRRHLFTYLLQTEKAFWAWPKETWIEVIQAAPQGKSGSGTRFWMITLAYVFCNFLYLGSFVAYGKLADAIFGTDLVEAEVNKLYSSLANAGYSENHAGRQRFRWVCALVM